jgi:hypothetical protein
VGVDRAEEIDDAVSLWERRLPIRALSFLKEKGIVSSSDLDERDINDANIGDKLREIGVDIRRVIFERIAIVSEEVPGGDEEGRDYFEMFDDFLRDEGNPILEETRNFILSLL